MSIILYFFVICAHKVIEYPVLIKMIRKKIVHLSNTNNDYCKNTTIEYIFEYLHCTYINFSLITTDKILILIQQNAT